MIPSPRFRPLPCAFALLALLSLAACKSEPANLAAQRNGELDQLERQTGMTYAWQRPDPALGSEATVPPGTAPIVLARLEP